MKRRKGQSPGGLMNLMLINYTYKSLNYYFTQDSSSSIFILKNEVAYKPSDINKDVDSFLSIFLWN